jgi:hypothetical protein
MRITKYENTNPALSSKTQIHVKVPTHVKQEHK